MTQPQRRIALACCAAILSAFTCAASASAQDAVPTAPAALEMATQLQDAFAAVAERLAPSIVAVAAYVRHAEPAPSAAEGPSEIETGRWFKAAGAGDYPGFQLMTSGSGFVVNEQGLIITCRHFLLRPDGTLADLFSVETHDRRHTICELVGAEPTLNLALLRLTVFAKDDPPVFAPVSWGDSGAVKVGHWAIGAGDPPGPERFFEPGVFTALPFRDCYQEQLSATYLQTSLHVHPQAYGGPLATIRGEVVGILMPRPAPSARATRETTMTVQAPAAAAPPLELALPSSILTSIVPSIEARQSMRSPWLGFSVMSREELREQLGTAQFLSIARPQTGIRLESVYISASAAAPSPATKAELLVGDWLVKFDGHLIHTPVEFQKWLYLAGVGKSVEIELFREGETFTRTVTIEERP